MDGLGPDGGNAHCAEWADGPEPKRPEYAVTSSFAPKAKLNFHAISKLVRESRGNNH